jgi:DNA-binding SARP family transcriptional activator/tetratricopeptide (TPR) repeat protein
MVRGAKCDMVLSMRLLGNPEITVGGQALSFRTRKVLALLIYLVVEGGMHSRESLMALLWPDSPAEHASVTLRGALSRLRNSLQPAGSFILSQAGSIGFDFDGSYDLDLRWLSAAVQPEAHADDLGSILEFDRGEFLAGFDLPDAPGFDTWAAIQREASQRQVEKVYDRLSRHQLDTHDLLAAIETTACWVARAPLSEVAYRRLMAAQALSGDRSGAMRTYGQCQAMLQDEFGIEPARETIVLAENIGLDRLSKQPNEGMTGSGSTGIISRLSSRQEARLPFEGRADEHSQLAAAFRQACQDGAQVVALIGAAGVGKTRLLGAFREWLNLDSPEVEIWDGRAFEMGGRLPYQPVIEALRLRLERENAPEDLLDDVWLAELSQLMPELRARYPDLPLPMTGDASFMRARLFSAVAALGSALSSRHPAVLILDDMQWADADTRELIRYLASRWTENKTPILLLLAIRQESFAADPLLREWLAQLGRQAPLTRLFLDSLSGTDVQQLVTRLAGPHADGEVTKEFGAWLWAETGGLPFFIEALLQVLVARDDLAAAQGEGRSGYDFAAALTEVKSGGQVQVPPGVREAILSRIDRLSEKEADILLAASVIGRECSFEALCQVANINEPEGLEAVEALLNGNLLAESLAVRRPYTFAHDYIREVVYSTSHQVRRRIFHRRALNALESQRATAAECAFHALASLLDEPAFRYSRIAGDDAQRANAFQESLAHYDRAREIAQRMSEKDVVIDAQSLLHLYLNRGRALELVEAYPAAQENYQEMLELAAEREDQTLELAALIAQCDIHARYTPVFNPPLAKEFGQAALELARELNDRAAEAAALGGLMFAVLFGGEDNQITLAYGEASLSLARELGLKEQMGSVLIHLWMPSVAQNQLGAAFDTNREAEAVWRELGNMPKLADTFEMRQFLHLIAAQHEERLAASTELHRLSLMTGNQSSQGNALVNMGDVHRLQGRLAEALTTINAALAHINFSELPLWKQSECYFRMDLYLAAGAMELAEKFADQMYAMQDGLMPMFQPAFLNSVARVKIACGKLSEGEAILDRALKLCSPDNVWSHNAIWIAITDACLQLALGKPERAFSRLEERVQSYRQAGFLCNLAEELWLRGRVRLALGEIEAAKEILLEAEKIAEEQEERIFLWQILATLGDLEELRGDATEAEKWREQACDIIHYIADRAGDEEDLRATFLAQPEVVRILTKSNMKIAN